MRLAEYAYSEHEGTPKEWVLERFKLGKVTLVVGQNGTGKSRTLNVIGGLARLLSEGTLIDGTFSASFVGGLEYNVKVEGAGVKSEELRLGDEVVLQRNAEGRGWLKGVDVQKLSIGLAPNQLAAFAKRDAIQHAYLEPLFEWADQFRAYRFGEAMGKTNLIVRSEHKQKSAINFKDATQVVALFDKASKEVPGFATAVANDLNELGYNVESVHLEEVDLQFEDPPPGPVYCIAVKERDLPGTTSQISMSQGMFRALALLIHLNYVLRSGVGRTITLDDIGEGLDYERATQLIALLIKKAEHLETQVVMSTNDRHVMNAVPLHYWALIVRKGTRCTILNYENSKALMDEFVQTGLSNIDFLRSRYWQSAETTVN
jgi:energy-coupling factor transporter ATP-binding protein EcfA2